MVRNVLGVIAGYVLVLALTGIMTLCLMLIFPAYREWGLKVAENPESTTLPPLPTTAIITNMVLGLPVAMAGGYLCARIAKHARGTTLVFAAIFLVAGVGYYFAGRGGPQPGWYLAALPPIGAVGVLLGGALFRRGGGRSTEEAGS
ncbi:MAG: hypothetical protein KDA21_12235 [Phycisphaerales bacterium]|nr:hypothetical protein [Phycisphaerales bacterium]